jgi:hypothetical protein
MVTQARAVLKTFGLHQPSSIKLVEDHLTCLIIILLLGKLSGSDLMLSHRGEQRIRSQGEGLGVRVG